MATAANPYAAPRAEVDLIAEGDEIEPVRIFSVSGRLGRVRYLAYLMATYLLVLGVAMGIGGVIMASHGGFSNGQGGWIKGLVAVAYISLFVMLTMFAIQRLHDFNDSGWWSLLLFVPLVNFFLGLLLLFKSGTDGRNRYGGKTPPNGVGVIILASLMPALVVIGIVAAVALPAYSDYVKRAQQAQLRSPH